MADSPLEKLSRKQARNNATSIKVQHFDVSGAETGTPFTWPSDNNVFGVVMNGTSGAFTGTIKIYGSPDGVNFDTTNAVHTFVMSGTATTAEVRNLTDNACYIKGRADVTTSITGTGAYADVYINV